MRQTPLDAPPLLANYRLVESPVEDLEDAAERDAVMFGQCAMQGGQLDPSMSGAVTHQDLEMLRQRMLIETSSLVERAIHASDPMPAKSLPEVVAKVWDILSQLDEVERRRVLSAVTTLFGLA